MANDESPDSTRDPVDGGERHSATSTAQPTVVRLDDETMAAVRSIAPDKPTAKAWYRQGPVLVSCAALAVSIISAVVTSANNRSNAQSQAQDQLTALVEDLSQIPGQQAQIQTTYVNDPTRARLLGGNLVTAQVVESQEASDLIRHLGNRVPAAAAYQVGVSLAATGSLAQGISMLSLAAKRASDPNTKASAYRAWAADLYSLSRNDDARAKISAAMKAYDSPDIAAQTRVQNQIFSELFQVPYEISTHNCDFARRGLADAIAQMKSLPPSSAARIQDSVQVSSENASAVTCR